MWEEIGGASKALSSASRVAIEVGILSVITTSCMCLCLHLSLSILLGLLDMFVEAVTLRERDEDAATVWKAMC